VIGLWLCFILGRFVISGFGRGNADWRSGTTGMPKGVPFKIDRGFAASQSKAPSFQVFLTVSQTLRTQPKEVANIIMSSSKELRCV